jgi:hypothetical protein
VYREPITPLSLYPISIRTVDGMVAILTFSLEAEKRLVPLRLDALSLGLFSFNPAEVGIRSQLMHSHVVYQYVAH